MQQQKIDAKYVKKIYTKHALYRKINVKINFFKFKTIRNM